MSIPALAGPLFCTDWQAIRTCQDGHGYVSYETQWQGRTYGDDNQGTRWSTSRWQGFTTTTITPPQNVENNATLPDPRHIAGQRASSKVRVKVAKAGAEETCQ